jgi:hypothetical protein
VTAREVVELVEAVEAVEVVRAGLRETFHTIPVALFEQTG